jgi:hypothetical protein
LSPIGGKYDQVNIDVPEVQFIGLYLPNIVFARLMDDYNLPAVPARSIRYSVGVQDKLIKQIGLSMLSEMMCPTSAGRTLVETSSLLLAARLVHAHTETELIRLPTHSTHRLDDRRLRRVLAYVEDHLAENITVAYLANVACLSIFHFTCAFACTMGVPPASLRQSKATGKRESHDRNGTRVAPRDCACLPVFLRIELHPRVPAGHGHDASCVPTNVAIAFLEREQPDHHHDLAAGAVSSAPTRLILPVRSIGSPRRD